jgi:DHA2 family multidrug resistance protein
MTVPATAPDSGNVPTISTASTAIPWAGLAAVLIGAFLSTMNTRISSLGLADIRGAVHAGFDDGAWITTAHTVGQMLIAPAAVWMGRAYGTRNVLFAAALAFAVISLLKPFSPNLPMMLGLQFVGGIASGFFVPLTLSFVLRNMPPRAWAYGIALYALNLEVSLNISASLEGWYVDNLSWHWIFWQSVPLAIAMALCLHFGVRPESVNPDKPRPDLFGFASGGIGLGLIYAALDQGNRLDWGQSPLVWALMLSGGMLLIALYIHERTTSNPAINLQVAFQSPLPLQLLLIAFLRLTLLSTSYVIPEFLQVVRGFRGLEVGQTLVWLAVPQLLVCLLAGYLLRRADTRFVAAFGFICICVACLVVAYGLTPQWGSDQFLASQLLQAIGQSFALSGTVFYGILHMRPQDALTFGAAIQTARLMGGELGQAFIVTFVRVRAQIASNLLGQHVQIGDQQAMTRVHEYAELTARAGAPGTAALRGTGVLDGVVHSMAITQGVIDSFMVIAALTALTVVLVAMARSAPRGPASYVSPFSRHESPHE